MQETAERRIRIIKYLCKCRETTVEHLACRYGVSERTIRRDLLTLSLNHPIEMRQGKGGGVYIMDGYRLGVKYLNENQEKLIRDCAENADEKDKEVFESILMDFCKPKAG